MLQTDNTIGISNSGGKLGNKARGILRQENLNTKSDKYRELDRGDDLGFLSQVAGLYGGLFVVSLLWTNYWLGLAVGVLGAFLVVALVLSLEDVDKTKVEDKWVREKISGLEGEIKDLKTQLKALEERRGKIELL